MYAPQLERFQRQLVLKIWSQVVSYYSSVAETVRELPHHLRLLWDGAFSFDDIYKPDSSFDVLKYLTVVLPTSNSDDIKISELAFDPYSISFPASNYSEDFNLLNSQGVTADADVCFLPVALEPPTPTTTQPLCLSTLVLVLFGLFTAYKSFSNRQDSRRRTLSPQEVVPPVLEKYTESDNMVTESNDTIAELREQLANNEQARMDETRERNLEIAMLVTKAADLEEANDSKDQAIISLNADVSKANAETETLRKSVAELNSQNKKYKEINYQYTHPKAKINNKNNQNGPSKGTPAAVVAPETSFNDREVIAAKTAKVSKLEREAVCLNEELQAKTEELRNKVIQSQASERTHKKERETLQKEVQTLRSENTTLTTEKDKVIQVNKLLDTKVTKVQDEKKAKDASIAELKRVDVSKELLRQMYDCSSKENEKLAQAKTRLQADLTAKDVEVAQVRQVNTKIQAESTEKDAELAKVSQQIGELQDKHQVLEAKSETQAQGTQTDDYVDSEIVEANGGLAAKVDEQAAELDQLKQEKNKLETILIEKDTELDEANRENYDLEGQTVEKDKKLNDALEGNAELEQALVDQCRLVDQCVRCYESIRSAVETSEQATQTADKQDAFEAPVEDEDLEEAVEDATTKDVLEEDILDQAPVIRLPSISGLHAPLVNHNLSVEPEPPAGPQEADAHQRSAKNVFPKPQKNLRPREVARRRAHKGYCYPAPLNVIIWIQGTDMREPRKVVYESKPYLEWGQDTSTTVVSANQERGEYEDKKPMQGLEASRWAD